MYKIWRSPLCTHRRAESFLFLELDVLFIDCVAAAFALTDLPIGSILFIRIIRTMFLFYIHIHNSILR